MMKEAITWQKQKMVANIEKGFIPSEVQNNFCIRSIQYENYRKQYHKLIHN
jgi:hypothetical protein